MTFCWLVFAPSLSGAFELVINPKPQVTKDTCQSYQIAFGLVATGDRSFAAETATELRNLEKSFRDTLIRVAADAPGQRKNDTTDHNNWRVATSTFTSGRYILQEKFFKTRGDLYDRVAALTGNKSIAVGGAALAAFTVKQPVFLSIKSVGPYTYSKGHIIGVFGVNYPTNRTPASDAQLPLAILNSAVRLGADQGNMCSLNAGDGLYRAEVFLSSAYELKEFGNLGYSLMWLEPNSRPIINSLTVE
jgi:hypothetical protein